MRTKTCSKCKYTKPIGDFYKRKDTKDGYRADCKTCIKKSMESYYKENKESIKQKSKEYYHHHEETCKKQMKEYRKLNKEYLATLNKKYREDNQDHISSQRKRYREENKDLIRDRRKSSYRRNRDKILARKKLYNVEHREQRLLNNRKRRARKHGLPDTLSSVEYGEIVTYFDSQCVICGEPYEHMDHFIPVSSGFGGTTKENMVPMCSSCNQSKYNSNPFKWSKQNPKVDQTAFKEVVFYLATLNHMSTDEYEEYVNRCFKGKEEKCIS